VKEGGNPEAGVVPEMMLHKNLLPVNFKPDVTHSIGKVGMYHFDLSSTVTAGKPLRKLVLTKETWTSAYAAVQTALTATEAALNLKSGTTSDGSSETVATFALIRPPGHHATTNLCGGYCYLNNVIICASYWLRQHLELKCIIVDVDFHHGNGVEEILQRNRVYKNSSSKDWRDRCQYISLHAHPEYPYYTTHMPTPVAKTVTAEEYIRLLRLNLENAEHWCADQTLVLVSLGLDTLSDDPIGGFAGFTNNSHYFEIGREIGQFVHRIHGKGSFILEGGYVVEKLGECVEAVLRGYMQGLRKL
jgi:acetoin utilization deacetylase AcuC-like enzyme